MDLCECVLEAAPDLPRTRVVVTEEPEPYKGTDNEWGPDEA